MKNGKRIIFYIWVCFKEWKTKLKKKKNEKELTQVREHYHELGKEGTTLIYYI